MRAYASTSGVTIRDSAASASAADIRRAGSFSSRARTTGSSAPARTAGRGSSMTTAVTWARCDSRSKGPRPSTAWYSVQPSENRSVAGVGAPPVTRSGARYPAVPTSTEASVYRVSPASGCTEMP